MGDDHRRWSLATSALPAHRPQVGKHRRLRTRPAAASFSYTYKGSNLVNAAVGLEPELSYQRPVADIPDDRSSQWGLLLAVSEIIHLLMNADFRREP